MSEQIREVALTTVDNPYSPIDEYDDWYAYDTQHGYCCDSIIARIYHSSEELPELQQNLDYERTIDDFVASDVLGIYTKFIKEGRGV